jgi:hypothetical protein
MLDHTDTTQLGIGHNNPPNPLEIVRRTAADLSRWMADHPAIEDEDDARAGKVMVDRARKSLDEMEAERDGLVRPLNQQVKAINDRYRPPRTTLEKLLGALKSRLSDYARALEVERVRQATEARRAAEEAERAAREAEEHERAAKAEANEGVCEIDLRAISEEADAAFAVFQRADRAAARAERDSHIRIAGGFDRALGLRERETLEVTDWRAAIAEVGLTDPIRQAILASARVYRRAFHELPDGVTASYSRSL